jgi:hypothetical protein
MPSKSYLSMNEISIYGKNGLFHNIIKQSRIMNGRYQVLPKGSHDLNMNNLLSGLDLPTTQYPGVFCLPPTSDLMDTSAWETLNFRVLFVCTSEGTGDNQIKYPDHTTNASQVNTAKDWNDMKEVALSFMNALTKIQKSMMPMADWYVGEKGSWRIVRFAQMQNDNLSGVMVMFSMNIFDKCEYGDIEVNDVDLIFPQLETTFH